MKLKFQNLRLHKLEAESYRLGAWGLGLGILFFFLSLFNFSFSQDIHFSQILNTPLLLNPATAGMGDGDFRASLSHKSQWIALTKYRTSTASFDMPLLKKKSKNAYIGAGLNVFADKAGTSQMGTTQATFSVSGILPVDDNQKVSVGLQGGVAQRSANLNKITWGNQFNGEVFDAGISSNEANAASFIYPDVAARIDYEFTQDTHALLGKDIMKFSAGAAIFHPHSPKQKFFSKK